MIKSLFSLLLLPHDDVGNDDDDDNDYDNDDDDDDDDYIALYVCVCVKRGCVCALLK